MNIENKIRELLESVDEKTPAQMSYPGATGPQDPAPYMGVNFEELELDRPGVAAAEIQQVQYPGQTMPDPEPLGPEYQELDPYNMAPTIQQVPKENYPIGSGADDVQAPQDPAAEMQADQYSADIKQAQAPAPFVAESADDIDAVSPEYQSYKPSKVSAKSQGQHIVVLDKNTAAAIEKKLGLPKGALAPVQGSRYSETVVVKGKDDKLHTVYAKDDAVRTRSYGHNDQESTQALADHLNEWFGYGNARNLSGYNVSGNVNGKEFSVKLNPSEKFAPQVKSQNTHITDDEAGAIQTHLNSNVDEEEGFSSTHGGHSVTTNSISKINEALDIGQQQVNPVDQQNAILQQAVQAVEAGNKIEDVAKATGLDIQVIQDAVSAAQPTASPVAPVVAAPVSESVEFEHKIVDGRVRVYPKASGKVVTRETTDAAREYANQQTGKKHTFDSHGKDENGKYMDFLPESTFKQDVESILGEETLSEEFKSKAAALFESTVVARVNEEVKRLEEAYEDKLSTEIQSLQEQYVTAIETYADKQSTRLNNYINYLGEQWIKQNRVALHQGIRTDLTEGFMKGLQKLFTEHYINVPADKVDVVAEQKSEIEKLQESITELSSKIETLEESNHNLVRESIITKVSDGLTDTEVAKLHSLCESVAFESEELFESKINMIRNKFFVRKSAPSPEQLLESTIHTSHEHADEKKSGNVSPNMERYIAALNKYTRQ